MIQIPLSNTLRMVRTDDQSDIQNFDNRLLHQEDHVLSRDIPYLQKIKSSDRILIQFATDETTPTAEVFDYQGNLISNKSNDILLILESTTFTVYNLDFTLANQGIYYLRLTFTNEVWTSNYFQIDGFDEQRLVKIEYNTSETDGILYDNNESFVIRMEGRLAEYQPGQNKEMFTSFDETLINLKSYPIRNAVFEFGPIPRYLLEKLNLALAHEIFKINDVEFQTEDDIESELLRNAVNITNMYGGSVVLQQVNYEKYLEATEDEPEEDYYRVYDTEGNKRTYNTLDDDRVYKY